MSQEIFKILFLECALCKPRLKISAKNIFRNNLLQDFENQVPIRRIMLTDFFKYYFAHLKQCDHFFLNQVQKQNQTTKNKSFLVQTAIL